MGRRRKRSNYARQRRYLSLMLSRLGHRPDHETVNRLTPGDLYDLLFKEFGVVEVGLINSHLLGEVLSDQRGLGSLQKVG